MNFNGTRMPFTNYRKNPNYQSEFGYQNENHAQRSNRRLDSKEINITSDEKETFQDRNYRLRNYDEHRRYSTVPYLQNIFNPKNQWKENININSTNEKLTIANNLTDMRQSNNKAMFNYPATFPGVKGSTNDAFKPASNLPEPTFYNPTTSTTSPFLQNFGYYNPYPSLTLYLGSHPQSFWNQWVRYRENASVYPNQGYTY